LTVDLRSDSRRARQQGDRGEGTEPFRQARGTTDCGLTAKFFMRRDFAALTGLPADSF
jgi:hypothetical protein